MYVYVGQNGEIVYDKCYESVAFFFAAYYNSHRYIEKARGSLRAEKSDGLHLTLYLMRVMPP